MFENTTSFSLAQKRLQKQYNALPDMMKGQILYMRIPVEQFDKEDLVKIIALCMDRTSQIEKRELRRLENSLNAGMSDIQADTEDELWEYALIESLQREIKKHNDWFLVPSVDCFIVPKGCGESYCGVFSEKNGQEVKV